MIETFGIAFWILILAILFYVIGSFALHTVKASDVNAPDKLGGFVVCTITLGVISFMMYLFFSMHI